MFCGGRKNIYYSEYFRACPLVLLLKVGNKVRCSNLKEVRKWGIGLLKIYVEQHYVGSNGIGCISRMLCGEEIGVNHIYIYLYLLTPWSRVLLEKVTSKLCS